MANNTALRFFKGASAPSLDKTFVGMIWFDTTSRLIKVCTAISDSKADWEAYGNVQNVTFEGNVLTVTKSDNSTFALDFSDVASAQGTTLKFKELADTISDLDTRVDANATAISGLDTRVTGNATAISTLSDALDVVDARVGELPEGSGVTNVVAYIDKKVSDFVDADFSELSGKLDDEIERATKKEGELAIAAENAQKAADKANEDIALLLGDGVDPNVLDSFKELRDYLEDHEEIKDGILDAIKDLEDVNADARLGSLETAVSTTIPEAISDAIAGVTWEYAPEASAEGKVAVITGLDVENGVLVTGQDKKTAYTEVYTVAQVDKLFNDAIGDGGSVSEQIADAIEDLDLPNTYDAKGAAAAAESAAKGYTDEVVGDLRKGENGAELTVAEAIEAAAADAKAGAEATAAGELKSFKEGDFASVEGRVDDTEAAIEAINDANSGILATAKGYTDSELLAAIGAYSVGETAASGLRKEIADRDANVLAAAKEYADGIVSEKNVSAEGDDYVNASATGNKVVVETKIDVIRDAVLTWDGFSN